VFPRLHEFSWELGSVFSISGFAGLGGTLGFSTGLTLVEPGVPGVVFFIETQFGVGSLLVEWLEGLL